jgi:hypothetical protein
MRKEEIPATVIKRLAARCGKQEWLATVNKRRLVE